MREKGTILQQVGQVALSGADCFDLTPNVAQCCVLIHRFGGNKRAFYDIDKPSWPPRIMGDNIKTSRAMLCVTSPKPSLESRNVDSLGVDLCGSSLKPEKPVVGRRLGRHGAPDEQLT